MPKTIREIFGEMDKNLEKVALPDLGDPSKTFQVEMSEPEINAVYSAVAFLRNCCTATRSSRRWWSHYGSPLESLYSKLPDDGTIPK